MSIRWVLSGFIAVLMVLPLSPRAAFAQDETPMIIPSAQRLQRIVSRLRLNEEEKAAVNKIFESAMPAMQKNMDAMQENQKQLSALLQSEALDEAVVRKLADAQGKIHADSVVESIELLNKVRAALNEEQRAMLSKRLQRQHGRERSKQRGEERKKRREQREKRKAEAQQQTAKPKQEQENE